MRFKFACVLIFVFMVCFPVYAQSEDKSAYQQITRLKLSFVSDVAWKPDGTQLAIVDYPSILLWDMASQQVRTLAAIAEVNDVAWSPDSTQIASVTGGGDQSLRIWNANTGTLLKQVINPEPYRAFSYHISWSSDGKRIASDSTARNVMVWELFGSNRVYVLGRHETGRVGKVRWSPDSTQVASEGTDGAIRVWDIATGNNVLTVSGKLPDWHPTDNKIAGSNYEGEVITWDSKTGRVLLRLEHGDSVLTVKWNFDGELIASGSLDGIINIWNAKTGKLIVTMKEYSNPITALAWHPHQNLLVSASDGDVGIWRLVQ